MGQVSLQSTDGKLGQNLSGTTDGIANVNLATAIAGEANAGSTSNAYMIVRKPTNVAVIDTTAATTLGGGAASDTHLSHIMVHGTLNATVDVAGFANSTAGAVTVTLSSGFSGKADFGDGINSAGALTVTASTTGDTNGKITVHWRPVT